MESFPSKAVRAFGNPVEFIFAPDTESFCISGYVNGMRTAVIAGLGATAADETYAFSMQSDETPVSEIADVITTPMRLAKHLRTADMSPFTTQIPATANFDSWSGEVKVSHVDLGEFVLSALDSVYPFVSKDSSRENLHRAQLELDSEYATLVSTDGHRLQTACVPYGFVPDGKISIPVPTKILDALKLSACLHFEYRTEKGGCVLTAMSKQYGIVTVWWQPDREGYPNWAGVVPDLDDSEQGYGEVPHCLDEFAKIHKSCRKFEMDLHFLAVDDIPIPAFGVVDNDMVVYQSAINEDAVSHLSSYFALSALYGYQLGRVLKKTPAKDISVHISSRDKPLRVDWERGDMQFTHILMPKRDRVWPKSAEM
ncbi:MAG: hypothetical protein VXZ72_02145 [Chlamydiota bacterium]|nr:hypothetical protein [Chlamydiota bacterium]